MQDPQFLSDGSAQVPDERPGHYYVTMLDDPPQRDRVAWLLGPLPSHQEALAAVQLCQHFAVQRCAWYHFHRFGTCRIDPSHTGELPKGVFNGAWPLEYVPGTQIVRPKAITT